MSYRSFKRVLGETNLERKCRLLFGISLLALIGGSFLLYGELTNQIVYDQNPKTGRLLVHTTLLQWHWEVLEDETFKNAASTIIKDFEDSEYEWRAIRPSTNSPQEHQQPKDTFEKELLRRWYTLDEQAETQDSHVPDPLQILRDEKAPPFEAREMTVQKKMELPDGNTELREVAEYQYYQPVYADDANCVTCHRHINPNTVLQEGDLQAIIQVRRPLQASHNAISRNLAILVTTAILTVFLAMILLYVIVRYVIVKPLSHLREVSDAISKGNTDRRAEISTRDEFEELAIAFNRMLQQLLDSAEELRHVNDNLDAKVDELAQANMRLFEVNQLKSDFLATMSHELRTPLNSIIGFSDVLSSIEALDTKQRRYVENIQTSGRILLDMINDTLDLAKIESGRLELHLSDFNLETIITAQCDMARPLAEKKNIDLKLKIEPDLPDPHQDQPKIQQILNNLLSNAIKFTPEGGRIDVAARRNERSQLEMSVADTGVGIAQEDQQVVFEKFRQGPANPDEDAMTREYSGTGLGLSIVKELCKLLGGEVTVESELGKGSRFTVRLPWVREEQPRLDSQLTDELHELTKPPRPDFSRHREASLPAE